MKEQIICTNAKMMYKMHNCTSLECCKYIDYYLIFNKLTLLHVLDLTTNELFPPNFGKDMDFGYTLRAFHLPYCFCRVTDHSQQNRMQVQNLAIVFGPTLMWTLKGDPSTVAISMVLQSQIVEFCLTEYEKLFK